MKIGIMQPYLVPYIGYFQLINSVDKFVFLDDVNFINKGWINRNKILLNNKEHLITVPLKDASQNKKINEIFTVDNKGIKLLKTIEFAYKKAPYFDKSFELLVDVFESNIINIAELTKKSIRNVCKYLEIQTQLINSSAEYNNSIFKGSDRIIDINKKLLATHYINPIGGINIYNKEIFLKNNIQLLFLKTRNIEYLQLNNPFVPNLSIVDILMFNSKNEIKRMLNEFDFV